MRLAVHKLPTLLCVGSFLCILLLVTFTSPVRQIGYAIVFFIALAILLSSLGYLLSYWQTGAVTPRTKIRIIIVSVSVTILLMLLSSQSLSWIDLLIVILVALGLIFYSGRRQT